MASKKRKPAGRKRGPSSAPPRREPVRAAPPEPWRPVHLILGLLTFGAAAIFYFIAEPTDGDEFATWFLVGLIATGVALSIYGIRRMRAESPAPSRLDELHPKLFFLVTWRRMDEEARAERLAWKKAGKGYDWRPLLVLCFGAVFLTLMEFWGGSRTFVKLVEWAHDGSAEPTFWSGLRESRFARLFEFSWWSGWRVLGYLLLPCLLTWLMRERVRDYGLETRGLRKHAWIYGFAFSIVFVLVVIVSYTAEFSTYYPFYKLATRSWFDFAAWELLYAAQFFSLEFFFRGWWLEACKTTMGSHAIFAMVVPYCMIHFGKPMPEALAAIVAGIVLGTLAMKTRSIWSGFLIHVSVAISMDVAALLQTTGLPTQWWPT